jgi:hypothetical protein
VNFAHDSRKVVFTEPDSIEAIRRLGCSFSDFNYRPQDEFRRAHCDDSVTQLLYTRNEQRRQKLIQQALEVREGLIKARQEKKEESESPLIRMHRTALESQAKSLITLQEEKAANLRRLVVQQLRDLFVREFHALAAERTEVRLLAAVKAKEDKICAAQLRALALPAIAPAPESPYVLPVDPQLEELRQRRLREAEARRSKWKKKAEQRQAVVERSASRYQEIADHREKLLQIQEERLKRWQTAHSEMAQKKSLSRQDRFQKNRDALSQLSQTLEEQKLARLEKLEKERQRAKSAYDLHASERQSKIDLIRQGMTDRVQKAQEEQQRQAKCRQEFGQKLAREDVEIQSRLREMSAKQSLKYADRSVQRDLKVDDLRHKMAADAYFDKLRKEQEHEELQTAAQIDSQAQKIISRRSIEAHKFLSLREQILAEFRAMADRLDEKRIRRVQTLIGADDEEMKRMIQQARETPTLKRTQKRDDASDAGSVAQVVAPPSPSRSPEPKDAGPSKRHRN